MAAASLVHSDERVLVCAGTGVVEAVEGQGAIALDPSDGVDAHDDVDAVIIGFHRHFDFTRLAASARALHHGARLISTNNDPTYPTPEGLLPGNGSLTAALSVAGRVQPTIAGKPYPAIADLALKQLDTQRGAPGNLVVGDLPATDGLLAVELESSSVAQEPIKTNIPIINTIQNFIFFILFLSLNLVKKKLIHCCSG